MGTSFNCQDGKEKSDVQNREKYHGLMTAWRGSEELSEKVQNVNLREEEDG